MSDIEFDRRLAIVEIKAILLDSDLSDEANRLASMSKTLSKDKYLINERLVNVKKTTKELLSIGRLQKSLLSDVEGFSDLDPIRRAAMVFLTSKIGYVGVTQNKQLWTLLNNGDYNGAANIIGELTFLNEVTRSVIAEVIRNGDE